MYATVYEEENETNVWLEEIESGKRFKGDEANLILYSCLELPRRCAN